MASKHGFCQGIFLATSILLLLIVGFRNLDFLEAMLLKQDLDEWICFAIFSSLSALLINQLYAKIYDRYCETRTGIKYIAISFFFVMIATYLVLRYQGNKDYQTSLALFVSSCLLGAGWWVQATISSAAARKAHTVNTIMNQRNSELFIAKNDNVIKVFSRKKTVHPIFTEYINDPTAKKFAGVKMPHEYVEAARDLSYVLNYYEFIAVGVINGDFDERLMKECFVGILVALEKRSHLVIQYVQKTQNRKTFESIVALVDRWSEQKSLTTRSLTNQNVEMFEVFPSQEEVDKIMAGGSAANTLELALVANSTGTDQS